LPNLIWFTFQGTTTSKHRQEQFIASLEQMRDNSGPSDTDGSASFALASVVPNAMEAVDEEAEEDAAELDTTEEPSGGDASIEEAATQAAP
jgi:hypothetical protein